MQERVLYYRQIKQEAKEKKVDIQIKVNGQTYNVIGIFDTTNRPNTARKMLECGIVETFYIQKPRGKKVYTVHQYNTGEFGKVIAAC